MITLNSIDEIRPYLNQEITYPEPLHIDQDKLSAYLDLSQDKTTIHDLERQENPVIPGNMILAMLPQYIQEMIKIVPCPPVMTVSYDKVSFKAPLHVNQAFRLTLTCEKLRKVPSSGHILQQLIQLHDVESNIVLTKIQITDLYGVV